MSLVINPAGQQDYDDDKYYGQDRGGDDPYPGLAVLGSFDRQVGRTVTRLRFGQSALFFVGLRLDQLHIHLL
jgi:hypothetical protein